MNPFWQTFMTAFLTGGGCSIILYLLQRHDQKKDIISDEIDKVEASLRGLGHDRITYLGQKYLDKGCISREEYENLHDYLFVPYQNLGGNGTAKKIMDEVNKLPMCSKEDNHDSE